MLTQARQEEILKLVKSRGSVTLQELKEHLHISESTIRRDLNTLDEQGRLEKVFGGAVAVDNMDSRDTQVASRKEKNLEEKTRVAQYAAKMITDEDFVFIDAGTTTACMLDYIDAQGATFVTNAPSHAERLAQRGCDVILLGGRLKQSTEAVVGTETCRQMRQYHFSLCFLGTNGVSEIAGLSTPDPDEAVIKQCAVSQTHRCFVLCDHSKFFKVSPVTFAELEDAVILTDEIPEGSFRERSNIVAVSERHAENI